MGQPPFQAKPNRSFAEDADSFFETRIRPLFEERCIRCHGAEKQEGGLRLDSRSSWQIGGDRGPAINAGAPETSLLVTAVRYENAELQMPPNKKLTDREVADLESWIRSGATDPRQSDLPVATRDHRPLWSLQPIATVQPPLPSDDDSTLQAIDLFVRKRLLEAGLAPSDAADRRTLIRRATFDLTGLPPRAEEVDAFTQDLDQDAYPRLIQRLLASPQYGEHWARHWLDVARYSDTKGYVYAREEKRWVHAAAYRDWVVSSFNNDLPYDQFVRLQIAADQIVPAGSPDLAAMGFLTLGRRFLGVTHDIIDDRIDVITRGMLGLTVACARCHDHKYDPISTRDYYSLYGLFQSSAEQLVACGQSTEKAFRDGFEQREKKRRESMATRREEQSARVRAKVEQYLWAQTEFEKYPEEVFNQVVDAEDINPVFVRRWQAFLAKDKYQEMPIFAEWHPLYEQKKTIELRASAARFGAVFAEIERRWRDLISMNPEATAFTEAHDERLRRVLYGAESPCNVPDEHIANIEIYFPTNVIDEQWKLQGEVDRWIIESSNAPAFSTILVDRASLANPRVFIRGNPLNKGAEVPRRYLTALGGKDEQAFGQGSGRLELANAIASPTNPLTPRVIVNRIWMHHFGRGLVTTSSDFGNRAEPPSHPELLDWLSQRFIDTGWSIKELHRTIMLSKTYQQASKNRSKFAQQLDPTNRLLSRMTAHRLSFEEARDAWLFTTGELNLGIGGKPEPLFDIQNSRRTLYAFIDRESVSPVLRMFDFANPDLSIPQRSETTVPQQALFTMNHRFIADRAKQITSLLQDEAPENRVSQLYVAVFQREPTIDELELAIAFVNSERTLTVPQTVPNTWSYGYGEFVSSTGRLESFQSLPHFNGDAWQGSSDFPDKRLGWLQLTAAGGHPGNDLKHAVVRRWTATLDGEYSMDSLLQHEPNEGDGIRGFVSHSAQGLLRSATLHHASERIALDLIGMKKGDTLDFIVDIRDGLNSDQFLWAPVITLVQTAGTGVVDQPLVSSAEADFSDKAKTQLNRWQQLAQVLMLSNEFMFVD